MWLYGADDSDYAYTNALSEVWVWYRMPAAGMVEAWLYLQCIDGLYNGKSEQFIETVVKFEDGRTGSVSATLKIFDAKTFTPVKAAA